MTPWAHWRALRAQWHRLVAISEKTADVMAEGHREQGREVPREFLRPEEQADATVIVLRPGVRAPRGRHQRRRRVPGA